MLPRPLQKYNTTSLPSRKANDRAGSPIAQHLIHEPASSTKVNERLSGSATVACSSERSVITPRIVTRNGALQRPIICEKSLMHAGGKGAVYFAFKRKEDFGVSTIFNVVPGRWVRSWVECNIRILVSDVPCQGEFAGRFETRNSVRNTMGFLV